MNKQLFSKGAMYFALTALLLMSCGNKKENEPKDPNVKTYSLSRGTERGNDWVYFSFKTGKEVAVNESNHKENMNWDIAFNLYNIRTNSGTSGKGMGGALMTSYKSIHNMTIKAPTTGYTVDQIGKIADKGGFPPPMINSSLNTVMAEACRFSGPPPSYNIRPIVFIIRTADGKYVKFQEAAYANEKGIKSAIKFNYAFID